MQIKKMVKGHLLLQALMLVTGVVASVMWLSVDAALSLPAVFANPFVWFLPAVLLVFGSYSKFSG